MSLSDDMTKHRVFVQRLANLEAESIKAQIAELHRMAKKLLEDGTEGHKLKAALRQTVRKMPEIGLSNMTDFAEYESKFSAKLMTRYLKTEITPVDAEFLRVSLIKTNIGLNNVHIHKGKLLVDEAAKSKSLSVAYSQFARRKADEVSQIISDGLLKATPRDEIFALMDDKRLGLHRAQAETLARTAVNYTANIAKDETVQANRDSIDYVQWISTLEENTCGYCEDLHEEVFAVDDAPDCPSHWNCSCELVPYVE